MPRTTQPNNPIINKREVHLTGDPLFVPKQEIAETTISIAGAKETTAEVFIQSSTSSAAKPSGEVHANNILESARTKYKCSNCSTKFSLYAELIKHKAVHEAVINAGANQDDGSEKEDVEDDDEEYVPDECVNAGKKDSTKNINQKLADKYRCPICDDLCADKKEFTKHMKFHQELVKQNDKHRMNTSSSENDTIPSEVSVSLNFTLPLANGRSSLYGSNSMENSTHPRISRLSTRIQTNFSPLRETNYSINTNLASSRKTKSASSLEANSTHSVQTNLLSSVEINSVSSIPTKSASSVKKHLAYGLPSKNKTRCSKELIGSLKLPVIPIGQCTCSLEKSNPKCDFCINGAKYKCANCQQEFTTYHLLKKHFTDFHKSARHFCEECGRGYQRALALKGHMNRHKGLLVCYVCSQGFSQKQEFEQHILTHRIQCDQCDQIYPNKNVLCIHKLEVHKGVTCVCKLCNKTFNRYNLLKAHKLRYHRNAQNGEFKCKDCDKIFYKRNLYDHHIYRHRLSIKQICEECGKEFKSVEYLKRHQTTVHLKKKYICDVCKKEFSSMTSKKNCQNKHAGIATYKCDMCDKAYFHVGSLVIHKRIHTGEKPYICFVCKRDFYSRQMLLKHCLSHNVSQKHLKDKLKISYQPKK